MDPLERELAAELAIEDEVDGSHAAVTELADDLEAALDHAVREPRGWRGQRRVGLRWRRGRWVHATSP